LSSLIIRETVGKILSFIIIGIGYIMVAFTAKKQGLHDMLAHTVVVYKKPGEKLGGLAIAAIIVACILPAVAILGILASVVLASLSVARTKGGDAQVQMAVASTTVASLYYLQDKNTFTGFQPSEQPMPSCSGDLITHVSPDGKTFAVFGKACSKDATYFCSAMNVSDTDYKPIQAISASSIPDEKLDCNPQ
jgi:type II secretory pathway pseudopilin PulG